MGITALFSSDAYKGLCSEALPARAVLIEALRTNTRISLSNIVVTTDFSQISKTALPYATALSKYEAKIVVAHALGTRSYLAGVPPVRRGGPRPALPIPSTDQNPSSRNLAFAQTARSKTGSAVPTRRITAPHSK